MIDFKFQINELPPSINRMYHPRAGRGVYKDPAAEGFEKSVWVEVKRPAQAFDCPLDISIVFEVKDKRKFTVSDIDNWCKCLLDSLQHVGVIKNDSLIYKLNIEKRKGLTDRVIGHIKDIV